MLGGLFVLKSSIRACHVVHLVGGVLYSDCTSTNGGFTVFKNYTKLKEDHLFLLIISDASSSNIVSSVQGASWCM